MPFSERSLGRGWLGPVWHRCPCALGIPGWQCWCSGRGAHAPVPAAVCRAGRRCARSVRLKSCVFVTCPPGLFDFWFPRFSRKDQHLLSPVNCWYLVLTQTRRESRDHATLNDIFMNNVIVRLSQISEDVIRLFKKVTGQPCFMSIRPAV